MISFPNAKINLGLQVLEKRSDGFHNIESFVYPVALNDVVEFLPADKFKLDVYGYQVSAENENLVTQAWIMLSEVYAVPPVHVNLLKTIPPGSGLGGGSSDAVHFMKAVNEYFKLEIPFSEMKELALSIGSDCPFFINNKPSAISGRGEIIEQADLALKGLHFAVVFPPISISTKLAYSLVQVQAHATPISKIISQPVASWRNKLVNDFEEPLYKIYPQLRQIKEDLYQSGAFYASMSGSGSAVYGIFEHTPQLKLENKKMNYRTGIFAD